jgi:hypothetical protein
MSVHATFPCSLHMDTGADTDMFVEKDMDTGTRIWTRDGPEWQLARSWEFHYC